LHFKHATAKDPYLGSAIGESKRLVGGSRGRLKTQPSFSYIKHNQNEGCVPLKRGRRRRGVKRMTQRIKGWDGDVERQLGGAGDEGNKGKEGGV